ncbi:MAG: HNH endonuclease [Sedimentisphaerales bacterium]
MNKTKTPQQKENYRMFKVAGQLILIDDFYYRRLFKDPDIPPTRRKYTFIKGFTFCNGYPHIVIKLKPVKTVRLSRYIMRPGRGEIVDHINRIKTDNRRSNLRIVNTRQNNLNRKLKNNTGLIGVSVSKDRRSFFVRASYRAADSRRLTFYCKDTPFNRILTALAHDKFVLQAGEEEYALLNFPCWKSESLRSFLLNEDLKKYKESSRRNPCPKPAKKLFDKFAKLNLG